MADSATLVINVISRATDAGKGLEQTSGKVGRFAGAVQKATGPALAIAGGIALIGAKAIKSASDLQQAQGAVETVFGKSAEAVKKFSETADTRMGLAASAYQNYAAQVGAALQNAGFSQAQSVEEADKIMQRAADMAATFGGTTAEAVEAINAAVSRSEFDPLEKYATSLNMTAVNAELAKRGQDDLTGAARDNAKATVILESIYGKTADTAGQFARESDSAAGSAQIASAQFENASAALGEALLPYVVEVTQWLTKLAEWISKNATLTMIIVGVLGAFALAILALNVALKLYAAYTILAGSATWAAFAPVLVPILLVVAAIALVVGAVILLWKKSETFRSIVKGVWAAIKTAAVAVARAIKAAWSAVISALVAAFKRVASVAKAVWSGIKQVAAAVANAIKTVWSNAVDRVKAILSSLKSTASNVWNAIKSAIGAVVSKVQDLIGKIKNISVPGTIKSAIEGIKSAIDGVINAVKSLINWIKDIPIPKIDWPSPPSWLPGVGKAAPAPAGVVGAALLGARGGLVPAVPSRAARGSVSIGAGGQTIVINVTGALDPEGVARQIRRVLSGHDRRVTGRAS